ncbi:MAG: bifunctional pyr operon transcriptional regulator/uracil phosphoribosyltransferase PyrR [Gemmatimonadetes bacterium]|nr:bifunctional pyr operon transcriptional regulator/uracil phosphoribosyltransferase PyrR [Gemmatimonadota bacterium]MBI4543018.1 bifunctional pyr operon transcriptional regulator/uracil phosphoribosyltransferase PyrR [Gemmatimonadota bacterium]
MPPEERQLLLDDRALARTLLRMAQDIVRQTPDPAHLVLIGVQRRGVELAARLAAAITDLSGAEVARGAMDITLYRDDLEVVGPKPIVGPTRLPVDLDGRPVWIVDDVLFTGRTVRAALDELADFGRPARVGLAVLIDRGRREVPIQADVVGERVTTSADDRVEVFVRELDGRDAVELVHVVKVGA